MTDAADTTTTDALADDPRPDGLRSAPSLVLVNTGNGKGKSSAAFGVMLRALAADWKVAVTQFVKSSDWKVGEEKIGPPARRRLVRLRRRFHLGLRQPRQRHRPRPGGLGQGQGADRGRRASARRARRTDLPVHVGLDRPRRRGRHDHRSTRQHVNIVITGRDAPAELIAIADTVTDMTEVKHAYQQGIRAKRGIDY